MAANTAPIFVGTPDVQWIGAVTTANNTQDLTTGTSYLVFTADATNGGYVKEVVVKADPANNTAATVLRLWINNGSTVGTASNSALIKEMTITSTTATATGALPEFVIPLGLPMPAGYKLYATIGTAPGGSGQFTITAVGGKY